MTINSSQNEDVAKKAQDTLDQKKQNFEKSLNTQIRKEKSANEEKGISIIKFAKFSATWNVDNKQPKAPVFLADVTIRKSGKHFLNISNEFEINNVLIQYFKHERKIEPSPKITELMKNPVKLDEMSEVIKTLKKYYLNEGIHGFEITDMNFIGCFDYSTQAMVKDLESEEFQNLVMEHELGEAIATADFDKIDKKIIDQYKINDKDVYEEIDTLKPSKEFIILDADSSQHSAVLAAGKDLHLIIKGPPGTGKSQTIANMISYCASLDPPKKILFVSEKRAAIDAVKKRLDEKELGFLTLDVFEGLKPKNKRALYEELKNDLENTTQITTSVLEAQNLDRELPIIRKKLISFKDDISNQTYSELSSFTVDALEEQSIDSALEEYYFLLSRIKDKSLITFLEELKDKDSLTSINETDLNLIKKAISDKNKIVVSNIQDLSVIENKILANDDFKNIESIQNLIEAFQNIVQLNDEANQKKFAELSHLFEMKIDNFKSIQELTEIAQNINNVLDVCNSEVFSIDVETITHKIGRLEQIKNKNNQEKIKLLNKELDNSIKPYLLRRFFSLKKKRIEAIKNIATAKNILSKYDLDYSKIEDFNYIFSEISKKFNSLEENKSLIEEYTKYKFNEIETIKEITTEFEQLLENTLLEESLNIAAINHNVAKHNLDKYFEMFYTCNNEDLDIFLKTLIFKLRLNQALSTIDTNTQNRNELLRKFSKLDSDDRMSANIKYIKKKYRDKINHSVIKYDSQYQKIRREANRKRGQANIRTILDKAPDLMLDVKPCWIMSPLVASQVLPRKQMFDIVIFDESSQVTPQAAVTAIARGKKLILAGDEKQLAPTNFFQSEISEDVDTDITDFESILNLVDALIPPLGNRKLEFHYRSRDERLISVSNIFMKYNLNTVPSVVDINAVDFIKVDTEKPSTQGTNPDEVVRVCEAISQHMKENKSKSLVVIAFGVNHQKQIEELFFKEYENEPHIKEFIEDWEESVEPFRIKNLETVQGDERDHVILSVGYGKGESGRIAYRFGPINQKGGDRRLNVAASRSKEKMTIVSTISYQELDDRKLSSEGPKMFKGLLQYFELEAQAEEKDKGLAGLQAFGNFQLDKPQLNQIEEQVLKSIEQLGFIVTPQFGVSGYYIDFVVAHPNRPGKWLLAVEFDGARYHSSNTARDRDRLRQNNLENLGWKFFRIWSTDWFNNNRQVLEDLENALNEEFAKLPKEN
jgi:superfamily I DNA and/or RNA helicase/very-short-patch-repair endonuclease